MFVVIARWETGEENNFLSHKKFTERDFLTFYQLFQFTFHDVYRKERKKNLNICGENIEAKKIYIVEYSNDKK